ncbi:MAG: hypothetical protein B7Z44_16635 [Caulobacter sp. 12-67-6]|nr:MAG: hypothetical protein B7Z44_16635 [Caulobacter sp. 12-67-6]OZA71195.1 MAG: hypothetical protein B7X77_13150 [Caulobacter sp. 39-67-4]HQR90083.1 lasso peptide biosynthesis B2 protein [Caulobacter sp.]
MRLRLAPGLHGAMIEGDLVLLDVAADAYFCLPAAARDLVLSGSELEVTPAALAEGLCEVGLALPLVAGLGDARPTPPPPTRTARRLIETLDAASRTRPCHGLALTKAVAAAIAGRRLAFEALLPAAVPFAVQPPTPALLSDLAVYRRIVPWLPIDGACLFRSHMLRAYLTTLGHGVSWVFGVRTWPFSAHCWLQAGDVALDDEAERLTAYAPILVL